MNWLRRLIAWLNRREAKRIERLYDPNSDDSWPCYKEEVR